MHWTNAIEKTFCRSSAATAANTTARIISDHKRTGVPTITNRMSAIVYHSAPSATTTEGWKRDQDPNIAMDRHLSGQCPMLDKNGYVKSGALISSSAPVKRVKKANECSFVKCSKIMVVPIQCPQCTASFCPSHRAPNQHSCQHASSSSSTASSSARLASTSQSSSGIKNAFQNLKISGSSTSSTQNASATISKTASTPASAARANVPTQSGTSSSTSLPFSKMFDKSEKWVPKPIFGKA